ncbi:hypothetical protein Maq22A_c28375 [Methylobacterium aquaticum]|uniref:Uncharacterized protein n=1 Tax=Methylobacterium aquaticum TaxID=270351 RepID=A0A1Y0ZC52_9HYPH|nr:hypothetical protein Maq22A_c28375 [Methylobacterium aquaticum]
MRPDARRSPDEDRSSSIEGGYPLPPAPFEGPDGPRAITDSPLRCDRNRRARGFDVSSARSRAGGKGEAGGPGPPDRDAAPGLRSCRFVEKCSRSDGGASSSSGNFGTRTGIGAHESCETLAFGCIEPQSSRCCRQEQASGYKICPQWRSV